MPPRAKALRYLVIVYLAIIITAAFLSVRGILDAERAWALEHWSRLLEGTAVLYAGGILAFGYALYRVSRLTERRWSCLAVGLLSAVSGAATWYLRLDRSLGDRSIFLEMLTHGRALRMSQPLTTAAFAALHAVTQRWDWPPRNSIALACSLAAAGATIVLVRLAARLPRSEGLALSLILPSSGLVVLFFGYVESTALGVALGLLTLLLAWKAIRGEVALWQPSLVLAMAILCHGLFVYLLPALILLIIWAWQDRRGSLRPRAEIYGAVSAFAVPFVLVWLVALSAPGLIRGPAYGDILGGEDLRPFVPLFETRHDTERYTLLSVPHLADLGNVSFLVSPFILLFLALGIARGKCGAQDRWCCLLYTAALSGLSMAFLWNPDLGMQQDWDLFGPFLLPVLVTGAVLLAKQPRFSLIGLAALSALNSALLLDTFEPVKTWSPAISALPTPQTAYATDIEWVEKLELIGFDASTREPAPGTELTFTLYLRGLQPMPLGYTVFLHLVDERGGLLSQDDHQPYPPTEYWPPGEWYTSAHVLRIPDDAARGSPLEVRIGAYFYGSLERLPMRWNGAMTRDGAATLITFAVGERLPTARQHGAARSGAD